MSDIENSEVNEIIIVNDADFEDKVLRANRPVLVDFWAPWCQPCKVLAPVLENVAPEYSGRLTIAKHNVDDNQESAKKYGIRGIPALLIFKEGEVVGTKVGSIDETELKTFIESSI